jgi:hypothetical protein
MSKTKKAPAKKTAAKSSAKKAVRKKTTAKTAAKTTSKSKVATKSKKAKPAAGDVETLELLNETGRRKENVAPVVERRKRRRQIDPTTCERDYNEQEIEFMQAMDDYKQQSGRMFPTCSEILEVLMKLGYRQVAESADLMYDPNEEAKKVVEEESLNTEYDDEEDSE